MEINNQDGMEPLDTTNLTEGTFEDVQQPAVEYFKSRDPFVEKKVLGNTVILPGVTTKEKSENITDFTNLIESNELDSSRPEWVDESFKKAFENGSDSLLTPNGIHQDVNVDDYDNIVTYGKDELITKKATFKKTNNVNTNAALFLTMAKNMSGMGTSVQLPLWNSGIWVVVTVPKEIDILYTMEKIANESIFIGSQTGKFIGTMHDAVFYNTMVDFVVENVTSTSVKLENKRDILKYILISDIQTLISGIINAMYPEGYTVTRSCKNNFALNEDGKTKCDFKTTGMIKPSLLTFKNNKNITPDMIVHMAKRGKDSVSIEEVVHYQNTLNFVNAPKDVEFKDENYDTKYKLTLAIPNIEDYQYMLNIWVNDLEADLERLLEDGDNYAKKSEKATKVLNANYLTYFLSYIKDIEETHLISEEFLSTVDVVSEIKFHTIKGMLELMSPINSIIGEIEKAIKDYINSSSVAIVGLPNYICPKCHELQSAKTGRDYDNIIPLDMMKLFFVLSQIRTM